MTLILNEEKIVKTKTYFVKVDSIAFKLIYLCIRYMCIY